MNADDHPLEYGCDTTRPIRVAFGVFVAAIALIPTTIVGVQWLRWAPGDAPLATSPGSIVPGLALALWGVWTATRHQRVTVDERARAVTWTTYGFSFRLRVVVWDFSDFTAITVHTNSAVKPQGYRAIACGPRGDRVLVEYFHSPRLVPREVRETARILGLPLDGPGAAPVVG